MEVRGADFVMYPVTDLARSIHFYRDTLGLSLEMEAGGMWAEFTAAPTTLALYRPEKPEEGPQAGGASIALAVADVQAAISELKEKGVIVAWEPFESPVCWMAIVTDPDGNSIILHQRKDGSVG